MLSKQSIRVFFLVLPLLIFSALGLADWQPQETEPLAFKGGVSTSQVLIEIISSTT